MPAALVSSRSTKPGCAASVGVRSGPRSKRIASRMTPRKGTAMMARRAAGRGRLTKEMLTLGHGVRKRLLSGKPQRAPRKYPRVVIVKVALVLLVRRIRFAGRVRVRLDVMERQRRDARTIG